MKYRVVLHEDGFYRVQYRSWWRWWITDSYLNWDELYRSESYPIQTSELHSTRARAIQRIDALKVAAKRRREEKPKKQEVVYTDP